MDWSKRNGVPAFNIQDHDWRDQLVSYLIENSVLIKEV